MVYVIIMGLFIGSLIGLYPRAAWKAVTVHWSVPLILVAIGLAVLLVPNTARAEWVVLFISTAVGAIGIRAVVTFLKQTSLRKDEE